MVARRRRPMPDEAHFFDGDYCVLEHDAANTKRIFSLLAELLALKTMANALAITPLVRVVP